MDWVLAVSITFNVVLVVLLLFRNEDGTLLRKALKAIADLGADTSEGTLVDRGQVVRMSVEALAGHEKSVLQRLKDWNERRKAAKAAKKAEGAAEKPSSPSPDVPPPPPAPVTSSFLAPAADSAFSAAPIGDTGIADLGSSSADGSGGTVAG